MSPVLPILEESLPLLVERGFGAFVYGFGVALFTAVAAGAAYSANAICTAAILTAIFGKF